MNTVTRTSQFIDHVVDTYSVQIWRKYFILTHTTQNRKPGTYNIIPFDGTAQATIYQYLNSKTKLTGTSLSNGFLNKTIHCAKLSKALLESKKAPNTLVPSTFSIVLHLIHAEQTMHDYSYCSFRIQTGDRLSLPKNSS